MNAEETTQNPPISLFSNPDFRTWLFSRFFANFARQMVALVVVWQVYEITKKPIALGLVGFFEALPFVTIGLWAGHAADRYEKKRQITWSVFVLALATIALAWSTYVGNRYVLLIYLLMGLKGIASTFEFASSSSYLQLIVDRHSFSKAVAWNLSLFQVATIAGPIFAGWIIDQKGPLAAYLIPIILFLNSTVMSAWLKPLESVVRSREPALVSIKEGLKFLSTQPLILACMSLDMVAVLFGDVIAILPVFAEIFNVGAIGLGVLRAAPAVGALVLSTAEVNFRVVKVSWPSFLKTVFVFGCAILGFVFSHWFLLATFFLFIGGIADGVSVIIRQSIYQSATPDHLRGRVTSVSSIFIRLSNEFGAFESGLAAQLLGTVPSVIFGASMTLLSVFGVNYVYQKYLQKNKLRM